MDDLSKTITQLQDLLISRATGGAADGSAYEVLRKTVVVNSLLKDLAPPFLRKCRTLDEFWPFIKNEHGGYAERRKFIWDTFRPMFERIEGIVVAPSDHTVTVALNTLDAETIHQLWLRAMERRETDPEGAITLSRTLLETVCKHILEDKGVADENDGDLPGLYKIAAKSLNIAPSQHSEQIFKQILGGCTAVVEGLGALRNRLSDAHGQGKRPVKPAPRHAELAVNLAGAVSMFLVATHHAHRANPSNDK